MSSTTFTPRTAQVVIYQGDDLAEIARLRAAADEVAPKKGATTLVADQSEWLERAKAHDEFAREAKERAVTVELRALGRKQWRSLVAEHPPRDGNEEDAAVGVNEETFADALVPASIIAPFASRSDCEGFLDQLNDAQYGELYVTAFALNRSVGAAPKASLVSEATQNGSETAS